MKDEFENSVEIEEFECSSEEELDYVIQAVVARRS